MANFAALPPEINSGLMYAGPGAGPMIAVGAAWDALADDLYLTAVAYGATLSDLGSWWLGPSSLSMATAGATYVSWITATALHAELTAGQAKVAVAAYEAAFATTVPPVAIAANRALLLMLVATNFFGQNTPAIMATEAEYVEMWAQDAAAMYAYASASSTASTLTPFTPPPQTTNSSGLAGLAAAVTQAAGTSAGTTAQTVSPLTTAAMPSALQGLATTMASSSTSSSPLPSLTTLTSSTAVTSGTSLATGAASSASLVTSGVSPLGSAGSLMNSSFGPATATLASSLGVYGPVLSTGVGPGTGALSSSGLSGATVSASAGRAASLGALSVPQGWTSSAPAFSQVASALPGGTSAPRATPPVLPASQTGPLGVRPANSTGRAGTSEPVTARYYFRSAVVQRPVYTG